MFEVQIIPNFALKCNECGMQLIRNQFGVYEHLDPKIYGGKCENSATKVHFVVDDKGFVKIEKF